MELVPHAYERFHVQHVRRNFSTTIAATVLVTNSVFGTNTKIIPIWYRYSGSAAATLSLYNGSGGASIWSGNAIVANAEQYGPWWDISAMSSGTDVEWTAAAGIGVGYMELWFIVVPGGAGTTQ